MTGKKNFMAELFKKLPHLDCGDCGLTLCSEFAKALLQDKKKISDCPHLSNEQTQTLTLLLDEYYGT